MVKIDNISVWINCIVRFKSVDVPANVLRSAPDFCTVYVISKGKISSFKKAVREAPTVSPLRTQIENQTSMKQETVEYQVVNALRGLIIYVKQVLYWSNPELDQV